MESHGVGHPAGEPDSRRAFLRRSVVGAGLVATVPVVSTFATPAGAAASDPAPAAACARSGGSGNRRVTGGVGAAIGGATIRVYSGLNCTGTLLATTVANANGSYDTGVFGGGAVAVYVNQDDGTGAGQCSAPVVCA